MFTPKVGVYICHCGINIAGTVDVDAVADYAASLPGVVISRHYTYMCSDPGQALIKQDIAELDLNRIVVASCSPLMHEPTFRAVIAEAGLNPYCLEMANIREQCSWVHPKSTQTTHKAMQLVASAVVKAALLQPLEVRHASVIPAALVIGGGVAGMQAALDIAEAGFRVPLVERSPEMGGNVVRLHRTFPTLHPAGELLRPLMERVLHHPRIHVMRGAELCDVSTGIVFHQITTNTYSDRKSEAIQMAGLRPGRIGLKIPCTYDNLSLAAELVGMGYIVGITAIFSLPQTYLACQAGAQYILPYVNRSTRLLGDGIGLVQQMRAVIDAGNSPTQIIAASIKTPDEAIATLIAGAHHLTIPISLIESMGDHPLSHKTIEEFGSPDMP